MTQYIRPAGDAATPISTNSATRPLTNPTYRVHDQVPMDDILTPPTISHRVDTLQLPRDGVTQNESGLEPGVWSIPPSSLSLDQLQDARWLPLTASAQSPKATALVAELAARVAAIEATSADRKTNRRKAGKAKLQGAVGAVVGGLLRRWARDVPEAVFRPRTPADFTGGPVASRQFIAASSQL